MKRVTLTIAAALLAMAVAGCATVSGPTDDEMIQNTLAAWSAGLTEQNIDKFLGAISENFTADQSADKAKLGEFIKDAIDAGYLEEAEVSLESAQYTKEGDKCTVYPVDLMSMAGSVAVELELTKEEGKWLITGMSVDGL